MKIDIRPDPELSSEQQQIVSEISVDELFKIDQGLKSLCTDRWQKMAKVIGSYKFLDEPPRTKLPDIFYAQRIRRLIKEGQIESRGYLESMLYCEVKLSNDLET